MLSINVALNSEIRVRMAILGNKLYDVNKSNISLKIGLSFSFNKYMFRSPAKISYFLLSLIFSRIEVISLINDW